MSATILAGRVAARLLAAGLGAGALAGCDTPNTRFADIGFGDATGLAAGGNLRLITERPRIDPAEGSNRQRILCSEPSPDYLVVFKRTAQANVKVGAAATPDGEGAVSGSAEETGMAGEGRTAGVIALRDGLYAACQAYANGIIGRDAYSAILSQYGLLIATVAVSDGKSAAAGHGPAAPPAASAFAAALVSCISGYDPSRPSEGGRVNPVLDLATCRKILQTAGRGRS